MPEQTARKRSFAQRLRVETAAVRLRHTKFGVRRALNDAQRAKAASAFDADGHCLSAAKKLLDTSDEDYRAVTKIIREATHFWMDQTVPYPEPAIRLLRKDKVAEFDARMAKLQEELERAVNVLQRSYRALREKAEADLGQLFSAGDYPETLVGEFSLAWEYPSIEPPDYLKDLHPDLYEEQRQRVAARFEEAVSMAEDALTAELAKLVSHLTDRLTGEDDGKPKQFQKSSIDNLQKFFERFKQLGIRSNEELERLVDQAQKAVAGVSPDDLRKQEGLRQTVAERLGEVQRVLDTLIVEKPTRAISLDDDAESDEGDDE